MKILNAFDIKIIALASMIIDHVGYMFFPDLLSLRLIGRMAFILYAFMLVEGFFHSHDLKNYVKNLLIWAIISEIPFDLAIHNVWFYPAEQNIFFSLAIGLIGVLFLDKFKKSQLKVLLIIVASIVCSILLKVDYSWYGISLIFLFYFLRNRHPYDFMSIQVLNIIVSVGKLKLQLFSFLGFIPIALYNGKKGRKTGKIYYSFYAAHLALLAFVRHFSFK